MIYTFWPQGVCSKKMEIQLDGGIVTDLRIEEGCSGNLQGIIRLVRGNRAEDMARLLRGVRCGGKCTSCPDQLAIALTEAANNREKGGAAHA